MRTRTSVLATLAAVAAAAGITIPVLASTSSATPAPAPSRTAADIRRSGRRVGTFVLLHAGAQQKRDG